MIELKFDKKKKKKETQPESVTFPITQDFLRLANALEVPIQVLPNLAFCFLDTFKNEPGVKQAIDQMKQQLIQPLPQEPLTKP